MNKQVLSIMVILLIILLGAVWMQAGTDKIAKPQPTPASAKSSPEASNVHKASGKTGVENTPAPKPITGAFGIPLGVPFRPSMVAKVISEQEQTYSGKDDTKLKGTLYRVEPSNPDKRFQQYSLKTTDKGIIYAIQGDYQYEVKQVEAKPKGMGKGLGKPGNKQQAKTFQTTCKAEVKTIAKELESRYGKPRGQGWDGLWFAFRQFSDTTNLSLRLYGHRCRTGMYSIIYTDIKLQRGIVPGKASISAKVEMPSAGSVDTDKVSTKPIPENVSASQTGSEASAKQ